MTYGQFDRFRRNLKYSKGYLEDMIDDLPVFFSACAIAGLLLGIFIATIAILRLYYGRV